jgi:DNA polymerase-3 subunit epsilon
MQKPFTAEELAKVLQLKRPMVWLDLEWTGSDPARIWEGSFTTIQPDGSAKNFTQRWNPGVPLDKWVLENCDVTDEELAGCPLFSEQAPALWGSLQGKDFGGYGIVRFDLPNLQAEFALHGVHFGWEASETLDVYQLWVHLDPRSLEAAVKKFLGREHEGAHDASVDIDATMEVALMMFEHFCVEGSLAEWDERLRDPSWIDRQGKIVWDGEEACMAIGKHKGEPLILVVKTDPGYIHWMLKSDFPSDTKQILEDALVGKYPLKLGRE